jgi:hypothetical protein
MLYKRLSIGSCGGLKDSSSLVLSSEIGFAPKQNLNQSSLPLFFGLNLTLNLSFHLKFSKFTYNIEVFRTFLESRSVFINR